MRPDSLKMSVYQEYITSDRWKCTKSPSGAHFWIIYSYQMTCKYCHDSKPVNTTALDGRGRKQNE